MGNRACIVTNNKDLAVYVHWNGGRESIEAFLTYCEALQFRPPETDCYGWARLCQVISNFFGNDGLSVGIDRYETFKDGPGDNGIYVIENWRIKKQIKSHYKTNINNDFKNNVKEILHEINQRNFNINENILIETMKKRGTYIQSI